MFYNAIPIKDLLLRAFNGDPNKIDELKPKNFTF